MGQAVVAAVLGSCAVAGVALAGFVWARRDGGAGRSMAVMLLAVAVWNLAYLGEILAERTGWVRLWGDLKYVGINALAPALLLFMLYWSGRGRRVTRRLVAALLVEPVVVLLLLANPGTHDLVREVVAPSRPGAVGPQVAAGPLFWVHLANLDLLMVGAVAVFAVYLLRQSEVYRPQALLLIGASILPWVANLGYNLEIGPLAYADFTPPMFLVSGAVLTWGLLTQRLLRLSPLAQRQVVTGLTDPVLVLDVFGHLVDTNPAAAALLRDPADRAGAAGSRLPPELARLAAEPADGQRRQVRLDVGGRPVDYEVTVSDLSDTRGDPGGRLVVMRDITLRLARERQLTALLGEQARVADTLSRSLRPDVLPQTPGVRLAAAYRPAGAGQEIGGDFYDVYPAADGWSFAIGDVSGKGASAAAVTALGRYSLRAFASAGRSPARTLGTLNRHILNTQAMEETYLTVAHGRFHAEPGGAVAVTFALGGHPPPILLRCGAGIARVGTTGAAVGLFADLRTRDTHVRLEPGDTLVFFTDGVTEARRGSAFFGEEGLVRCLSQLAGTDAEVVAAGILRATLDFQDQQAADDIAVLVLQAPLADDEAAGLSATEPPS